MQTKLPEIPWGGVNENSEPSTQESSGDGSSSSTDITSDESDNMDQTGTGGPTTGDSSKDPADQSENNDPTNNITEEDDSQTPGASSRSF